MSFGGSFGGDSTLLEIVKLSVCDCVVFCVVFDGLFTNAFHISRYGFLSSIHKMCAPHIAADVSLPGCVFTVGCIFGGIGVYRVYGSRIKTFGKGNKSRNHENVNSLFCIFCLVFICGFSLFSHFNLLVFRYSGFRTIHVCLHSRCSSKE